MGTSPDVASTGAAPVAARDRIASIDVLRGFALLGILIMNIESFGLVNEAFSNPIPDGALSGVNFWTFVVVEVLFEGSMRAIFSMLFGAGVVLFTAREDSSGSALSIADLYYRRTIWLIGFGLLDAFVLLWPGDILYTYGVVGLFLFPLRNVDRGKLLGAAALMLAVYAAVELHRFERFETLQAEAAVAEAQLAAGKPLGDEQREAIDDWRAQLERVRPTQEDIEADLAMRRSGYLTLFAEQAPEVLDEQAMSLRSLWFWDAFSAMLLGMALHRYRVFDASRSRALYRRMALLGFAIGVPVNAWEVYRFVDSGYDVYATILPSYDIGRLGCAFGFIGLVMLACKSARPSRVRASLAAVGRMALTNYLMHSLIGALIFTGLGFGLVGALERHQLYGVVAGIWLVQLVASPVWLRRYRFGPAEWLWRSLTYGARQPMRS